MFQKVGSDNPLQGLTQVFQPPAPALPSQPSPHLPNSQGELLSSPGLRPQTSASTPPLSTTGHLLKPLESPRPPVSLQVSLLTLPLSLVLLPCPGMP